MDLDPNAIFPISNQKSCTSSGGSRKKYLGAWPLIILGGNYFQLKLLGPGQDLGGCTPWPQPRTATVYNGQIPSKILFKK